MLFYALVASKLLIGLTILISYLNISGKNQLSQMTPIDLIGNFIFGGIIGGVIYNGDIPFYEYILILLIGITIIHFVTYCANKFSLIKSLTVGHPIPIIKNSEFILNNIKNKKNKIDIENIALQLRAQGIYSFDDIKYAQVEPNGVVTVINDNNLPAKIIVKNGKIQQHELCEELKKDEKWLLNIAKERGIKKLDDVFFAEYWKGKIQFILENGKKL